MSDKSNTRFDEANESRFSLGTDAIGHWGAKTVEWCLVIQRDPSSSWIECRQYDTQVGPSNTAGEVPRYPLDPRDPSVPAKVWQAARVKFQAYDRATRVGALPEEARVHFFELLAYHLTFVVSRILSEEGLADADKVGRVTGINHLLREVTERVWKMRQNRQAWCLRDIVAFIEQYQSEEHPSGTWVQWAIEQSQQQAARHAGV